MTEKLRKFWMKYLESDLAVWAQSMLIAILAIELVTRVVKGVIAQY